VVREEGRSVINVVIGYRTAMQRVSNFEELWKGPNPEPLSMYSTSKECECKKGLEPVQQVREHDKQRLISLSSEAVLVLDSALTILSAFK